MALHVTLTGVRGLLAPPAAILAYYGLRRLSPGIETWSLVLPVGLAIFPEQFDRFALYCFLFILGFNAVLWSVGKALVRMAAIS